jgi:hypothetical protein
MKLLRHPIRAIREPFGTAGLILACVALIAALSGGAYAASGGLNGKQKKEVEKIAKKYAGKPGATGPAGPAGAAGKNGTDGTNGTNGAAGGNGESVILVNESPANCAEGGFTYEVQGSGAKNEVCNGDPGVIQPGETLPVGVTETGSWFMSEGAEQLNYAPISFAIPLAADIDASHVLVISSTSSTTEKEKCDNGVAGAGPANPQADPGFLCAFVAFNSGTILGGTITKSSSPSGADVGAATAGALLNLFAENPGLKAWGTFAVTGG